jgi:hypothetical protein
MSWDRTKLIFIDESPFYRDVRRSRGRSRRGRPAYVTIVPAGNRINVCAAVSPIIGLVCYTPRLDNWDQHNFKEFMLMVCNHPLVQWCNVNQ